MGYVLISDDDGHWYVCPADKADEAGRYFEAVSEYWSPYSGSRDDPPPVEPDYLDPVGGAPSLVVFAGYRIA